MFRLTGSFLRLNGSPSRRIVISSTRLEANLFRQSQHQRASFIQRVAFSSKKDDRADPPPPKQPIDYEAERKIGERKLEARPSEVSTKSSTTNALKTPVQNKADDPILQNELKHDMGIIKDTFSLDNVPRESRILGLAGTVPYLATSLSTLYLGWDLKQSVPTGNWVKDAIAVDHETAQYLISVIEPIQLGYGAVIISFLGAIHWGLEYAEKTPHPERTRFRYGMGLASSIIAWPTLMMPVPYALTTQFAAFVGLYFADARATTRGWAPHWYGSYRFMLTAMVGLALFLSLIGRQKMGQGNALTQEGLQARLEQTGRVDHETDWAKLEAEEKERQKKEKAEAEKKAKKEEKQKKKKGKEAEDAKKDKASKADNTKVADGEGGKKEEKEANKGGDENERAEEGGEGENKEDNDVEEDDNKGGEEEDEQREKDNETNDKEPNEKAHRKSKKGDEKGDEKKNENVKDSDNGKESQEDQDQEKEKDDKSNDSKKSDDGNDGKDAETDKKSEKKNKAGKK